MWTKTTAKYPAIVVWSFAMSKPDQAVFKYIQQKKKNVFKYNNKTNVLAPSIEKCDWVGACFPREQPTPIAMAILFFRLKIKRLFAIP